MQRSKLFRLVLLSVMAWSLALVAVDNLPPAPTRPQTIDVPPLRNVFSVTTNVFSGNSPDTAAAFAALAKLGVKTIISVDGAKPDVAGARKHGLRYVHLPIGYDGVPTNRVAELVKAARTLPGPFYVHCHHGKHRGPSAAAVICEATAGWTTNQAVAFLQQAGTADDYAGLYRSVQEFHLPSLEVMAALPAALPEVAPTPALVAAMVAVDEHFDRLNAAQPTGWREVPHQPDIAPAHEATLLWEQFRELLRADDVAKRGEDYRAKMAGAEKAADALRQSFREGRVDAAKRDAAFQALGKTCANCHKKHRN